MKALIVCAVRRKFRGSQPEMGGMISSDWRVITTFQFRWGGGESRCHVLPPSIRERPHRVAVPLGRTDFTSHSAYSTSDLGRVSFS